MWVPGTAFFRLALGSMIVAGRFRFFLVSLVAAPFDGPAHALARASWSASTAPGSEPAATRPAPAASSLLLREMATSSCLVCTRLSRSVTSCRTCRSCRW